MKDRSKRSLLLLKAFEEYNKAKDDKIVYMSIISYVLSLIVKMANI